MLHELKIEKQYLDNLVSGRKKAEVRINDRDYQLGDEIKFTDHSELTAEHYYFTVTHVHSGLGLRENYVVLSLEVG